MANFLDLHAISKQFGGVVALRNVDLSLPAGEVHCLVGENGSGKSTLIKIIAGVLRPEPGGRIVIEGRAHPHLDPVQSTACGIQVIYQDLSLFPNLSVAENIAVAGHLGAPRLVNWRALRAHAEAAMARIGASLDPDAPRRRPFDRQPPARRDLPRDGGRGPARHHGRADRVALAP